MKAGGISVLKPRLVAVEIEDHSLSCCCKYMKSRLALSSDSGGAYHHVQLRVLLLTKDGVRRLHPRKEKATMIDSDLVSCRPSFPFG